MSKVTPDEYPFCLPSYAVAFDDGQFAQQELKADARSWRSEGYAEDSNLLILDHNNGEGTKRYANDADIDSILAEDSPQVRFIVLLPQVQEKVAENLIAESETAAEVLRKNELWDQHTPDPAEATSQAGFVPNLFNVSRSTLFKILTKHDFAPAACSHVRGQEQIFGARVKMDDDGKTLSFEFWYALRARAYYRGVDKDADLKMTIVTKYDVASGSTVVLLKYRSFNDLPLKLKVELIDKVTELVMHKDTKRIAGNPFALHLLHLNSTAQWYRRAARDPRDSVRAEENEATARTHNEMNTINVRTLHLSMRNLDQDKVQLTFILGVIARLRKQHDLFYKLVRRVPEPDKRDWLYIRVEEEFDRFENQITYFRSSIEDVSHRAQRLLDLLFNLSQQQNARWNEKVGVQAMQEAASMKAVAIVSMLFLPGTFVTSIFGTNLFSMANLGESSNGPSSPTQPLHLVVASQWWLLIVTTIPLTAMTFLIWTMWKSQTVKNITQKVFEVQGKKKWVQRISERKKVEVDLEQGTIPMQTLPLATTWQIHSDDDHGAGKTELKGRKVCNGGPSEASS